LKIRFQADADLDEDIVTGLRRREPVVDFQTATEAGLRGLDDQQVLERAAEEQRVLVSHDRKTMPHHFADFILRKRSPGLVIISQKVSTVAAIEELLLIWTACEAEQWTNRIAVISL
jgi:hypothetical protein